MNGVTVGKSPQMKEAFPLKFGSRAKWRDETAAMLRAHGFNGSGAGRTTNSWPRGGGTWSTPRSWTSWAATASNAEACFEPGHLGYPQKCIFAFDPEFEKFADRHAQSLAAKRTTPSCRVTSRTRRVAVSQGLARSLPGARRTGRRSSRGRGVAGPAQGNANKNGKLTDEDREAGWASWPIATLASAPAPSRSTTPTISTSARDCTGRKRKSPASGERRANTSMSWPSTSTASGPPRPKGCGHGPSGRIVRSS